MGKNLYKINKVPLFAFFSALALSFQVQAQTPGASAQPSSRQAKVKIIKAENGQHVVLDTTFTLADGQSIEEVVKKLQESNPHLKGLGFKTLKGQKLQFGKEAEIFGLPGQLSVDSLRTMVFRAKGADSLFFRKEGVQKFKAITITGEQIKQLEGHGEMGPGKTITIYRTLSGDSLRKHQIFRVDSAFSLRSDSILLKHAIRVEKDGDAGEVKVFRLPKSGEGTLVQESDFEVIKREGGLHEQIIILRKPAAGSKEKKKKSLKAESKSHKKAAESISSLGVQFYPNPTSGVVNLSFTAQKKTKALLRVVDSYGKTKFEEDLGMVQGSYSKQLNLSAYGKGVYVVQVVVGGKAQSGKVVVQ
ncbi:hypothetical protein TH63_06200 [Rufibacter radiotolerans]|uniref:Secretion system C-terminal sorting domain-containing protein n=1 Tax=Rufibacter radiotolerans TaxID=1379910 RepID=A0A0H4W4H5_9BACT|nr:T9SS type A sorting domain-containing protein [Rufibacter radiotolerans]AKQ45321.1 hypothetical protein TH63_06200 [Rufibacter radiotolerans]